LLHRAFGLVQDPGLTDVLIGLASAREAIRPDVLERLDVLPAGSSPPNPSELLGSDAMHGLVGEVRRTYDYIVVDTPPVLPVTDATVVSTIADATILTVRSGETEATSARPRSAQAGRCPDRGGGAERRGYPPGPPLHVLQVPEERRVQGARAGADDRETDLEDVLTEPAGRTLVRR
jgi:hypothetical protein